ncbi:hypothetical protein ABTY61_32625 [Kitasatospora sp. NPDC096128]|uniref:hypothetical protein n=1 Tax=Kitasatospora sp. NPDC096128 TaxID=3155547 RepID=UPI003330C5C3
MPTEPRHSEAPGGATLCTLLPFALLLALLAWAYPLTAPRPNHNHPTPHPTSTPSAAP